jgi:hypothetical protein
MKIAVPTYDGINIVNNLVKAKGFLVFTIQFGEIIEEEFRPIQHNDLLFNNNEWIVSLDDCSEVIVSELNEQNEQLLQKQKCHLLPTNDTIIARIILNFLNTTLVKESNTLCCP